MIRSALRRDGESLFACATCRRAPSVRSFLGRHSTVQFSTTSNNPASGTAVKALSVTNRPSFKLGSSLPPPPSQHRGYCSSTRRLPRYRLIEHTSHLVRIFRIDGSHSSHNSIARGQTRPISNTLNLHLSSSNGQRSSNAWGQFTPKTAPRPPADPIVERPPEKPVQRSLKLPSSDLNAPKEGGTKDTSPASDSKGKAVHPFFQQPLERASSPPPRASSSPIPDWWQQSKKTPQSGNGFTRRGASTRNGADPSSDNFQGKTWNQLQPRSRPSGRNTSGALAPSDFWSRFEAADTKTPPPRTSSHQNSQGRTQNGWERGSSSSRPQRGSNSRRESPQFSDLITPVESIDEDVPRTKATGSRNTAVEGGGRTSTREKERRADRPKRSKPTRSFRNEEEDDEYDEDAEIRAEERRRLRAENRARREAEKRKKPEMLIPEFISVSDLASALGVKIEKFVHDLEHWGFEETSVDSIMTGEAAGLVAQEYGFEITLDTGHTRDLKPRPPPEDLSLLSPRPPVVAIMGHVDHGKTTLLDWLRKSSVAAQEHGGITQHIGAFVVKMSSGKHITFLDTPGHAAFLSMRQRGAKVTDIVVLVVAADDSVKPQTLEALKHAIESKVPIIVAITKVDKEDARVDQVKSDLGRHGVELEDFGGDVQVVCVSGKTGQGMDDLEENIITLSEILDIQAETDGLAEGWVLEANIKPVGKAATILVKRGTLRPGDCIVAGNTWARVRSLRNEAGVEIDEAPPGSPAEVLGWRDELPSAGDEVLQAPDESAARIAVAYRLEMGDREKARSENVAASRRQREAAAAAAAAEAAAAASSSDPDGVFDWASESKESGSKLVHFIVKGDVVGSVEAICGTVLEIGNNEVQPRILRSAAGQISESDVDYAATSGSTIINFNNTIPGGIKRLAEDQGVRIIDQSIIYRLADEVRQVLSEQLEDRISHRVLGEAEILQVFKYNVKGRQYITVAGCRIRNGVVRKVDRVKILRRGRLIFDGKVESLKHGKKEVAEMRKGGECGLSFTGFEDFQEADTIQVYEEVREKRHL